MKTEALYTRSVALAGLPEFIEGLGGNPQKLFAKAGLNIAHAASTEHFVSWGRACHLLELAALELDEPSFGLKWAYHVPKDFLNSGPMLFLANMVPTVRDFLDMGIAYQKIHTNGVSYTYYEDLENGLLECYLHVHPATPPCRQYIEHIAATTVLLEKFHTGGADYKKIQFQHNAPKDMSWHNKTFDCPVEFNADKTMGVLGLDFIDHKIGGTFKVLQPLLKFHLNRKIKKNPTYHKSIKQMVEEIIPTIMGVGSSSITRVADIMELNPKKLQRLLKEEGTSYSDVLDAVRQSMAKRFLFESDAPITRIALLLDYASSEAFNTACTRWVGCSPKKYREQLRGKDGRAAAPAK